MGDTIIRKWALYIHRKSMHRWKYWPIVWVVCAIFFIVLYSYHKTGPILIGAVIFIFAAVMWTERRAFSEIIEEKERQIEALEANRNKQEDDEPANNTL